MDFSYKFYNFQIQQLFSYFQTESVLDRMNPERQQMFRVHLPQLLDALEVEISNESGYIWGNKSNSKILSLFSNKQMLSFCILLNMSRLLNKNVIILFQTQLNCFPAWIQSWSRVHK